jgi:hypothetical protein
MSLTRRPYPARSVDLTPCWKSILNCFATLSRPAFISYWIHLINPAKLISLVAHLAEFKCLSLRFDLTKCC